jgi:D-alanine transaminase
MPVLACLNGEIMPAEEARVPIWDRGFLFGDAIYEVWRLCNGRLWLDEAHTRRLERSLGEVGIGGVDFDRLKKRIHQTIAASDFREGTVYVQITRGVAPRLHAFPDPPVPPTELIVVRPYDDGPMAAMREVGVKTISLPDLRWKRCDVKSTNLLANVMANNEAHRQGGQEAILVDEQGRVTEATHSSLLWVREGVLEGTSEGPEILPGTTRGLVLRLAREEGVPFREAAITLPDLKRAQEVILVGTTLEVLPVVQIDDDRVADGRPGPITRRLQAAYRRELERWLRSDEGKSRARG